MKLAVAGALGIVALAALPSVAVSAVGTSPSPATTTAPSPAPAPALTHGPGPVVIACGPGGAEMLAQTAGAVAQRIYAGEVRSSETASDKKQIETDGPLIAAVASGEKAAIKAAVHTLVYSHTHIVRLRLTRGSEVLDDEGGPYILAPISGTLRSHGKTLANFVFSVQDDLGYVKLVTRFLGAPLILRTASGQVPVEGLLSPGPASIPDHGPVEYRGASYEAYSFNADAYPSGRLRVSLMLPATAALAAKSCAQIKTDELGLVAQRISRRFTPQLAPASFAAYIKLTRTLTHGLIYVRKGSHQLAGSTPRGPSSLPVSGAVEYHGVSYGVSSFQTSTSVGAVRVYTLIAQ
jgi:hypothetical protein